MAIGTTNIRDLLEEARRQRELGATADRLAEPPKEDPTLPTRRGPGAQAAPAAGEEPLRPADSPLRPLEQSEARAAKGKELADQTASTSQGGGPEKVATAITEGVEAAGGAVAKGLKMVGDGLSRAKNAAGKALTGTYSPLNAKDLAAMDKKARRQVRRDKSEAAGKRAAEEHPELRDQYEAFKAENPWAKDMTFDHFAELTLVDGDGEYEGGTQGTLDAMDIERNYQTETDENEQTVRKDPSMKFEGEVDGIASPEREERNARNKARRLKGYKDRTGSVPTNIADDSSYNPDMPAHLQPRGGNLVHNPEGGRRGEGSHQRRGMDMGPGRQVEGATGMLVEGLNKDSWDAMDDTEREAHVMYLADRLGVDLTGVPEEDQYYAAKRAVMAYLYKTGDGATRIWANEEGDLGNNTEFIDPDKKPMLENKYDDNTKSWVLKTSDDAKDRASKRAAAAHAAKALKGWSQIDEFVGPDGTVDKDAVSGRILEKLGVDDPENMTDNERLAYEQAMRLAMSDIKQHWNVKQQQLTSGRGQLAMGSEGTPAEWRKEGNFLNEYDAAETDAERADLLRKYQRDDAAEAMEERVQTQIGADAAVQSAQAKAEAEKEDKDPVGWDYVDEQIGWGDSVQAAMDTFEPEGGVDRKGPEHRRQMEKLVLDRAVQKIKIENGGELTADALYTSPLIRDWADNFFQQAEADDGMTIPEYITQTFQRLLKNPPPERGSEWRDEYKPVMDEFVATAIEKLGVPPGSPNYRAWEGLFSAMWLEHTGIGDPPPESTPQAEPQSPAAPSQAEAQLNAMRGNKPQAAAAPAAEAPAAEAAPAPVTEAIPAIPGLQEITEPMVRPVRKPLPAPLMEPMFPG